MTADEALKEMMEWVSAGANERWISASAAREVHDAIAAELAALREKVRTLGEENAKLRGTPRFLDEALNMGDGSYKP